VFSHSTATARRVNGIVTTGDRRGPRAVFLLALSMTGLLFPISIFFLCWGRFAGDTPRDFLVILTVIILLAVTLIVGTYR
jgi:hypothetical protein